MLDMGSSPLEGMAQFLYLLTLTSKQSQQLISNASKLPCLQTTSRYRPARLDTWDWGGYHWIGLEKDINCYRFLIFLISHMNIWKDFKVLSRFMQNWIQPPACLNCGLHRILSSYWLAHFHLMKKSAKVLLYFGLDCGMLEFFTHEP